jgi:hypothetical protein
MSNYHYYENRSCGCNNGGYTSLENVNKTGDACLPDCMNRFIKERSVKDQMDYNNFLQQVGASSQESWDAKVRQFRIPKEQQK